MAPSAPASSLRQILDERVSQLLREAESVLDAQAARQAGEARGRARREAAEQLNQAARRMRHAADAEELGRRAARCGRCIRRRRGAIPPGRRKPPGAKESTAGRRRGGRFRSLEIPLASAPALAAAAESRDPVCTATAPTEISSVLANCLDHPSDARAWVFPVARTKAWRRWSMRGARSKRRPSNCSRK